MLIFGLDFTSAPSPRNPLVLVTGELAGDKLEIRGPAREFYNQTALIRLLKESAPYRMGIDFPFGLPHEFVTWASWPTGWKEYGERASALSRPDFLALIQQFKDTRPAGEKHPLRPTDRLAGACSPLMAYGVPVARMFHVGLSLLRQAGAAVSPFDPVPGNSEGRSAIFESYPKLISSKLSPLPYKGGLRHDRPARTASRLKMFRSLQAGALANTYGLSVRFEVTERFSWESALIEDHQGTLLDSIFSAVQAAWASQAVPILEQYRSRPDWTHGWIADPTTLPFVANDLLSDR